MFGLAAIAAIASMAFIGASSASAAHTALCSANEALCAESNLVKHVHMTSTANELLANFVGAPVNVTCEFVLALLHVEGAALANPLVLRLLQLIWQDCEANGGQACEVSTLSFGTFLVLRSAEDRQLGTAQSHGTNVNVSCGPLINCTYGGLPTLDLEGAGHTEGAGNGKVTAGGIEVEQQSGLLCPPTANWHAEFSPLVPIYGSE
jgi:hypothetical protein